jgi:hypothetical protein
MGRILGNYNETTLFENWWNLLHPMCQNIIRIAFPSFVASFDAPNMSLSDSNYRKNLQ